MTDSKLVSVKIPMRLFRALPPAHEGRSQFIVAGLEEKIQRRDSEWEPATRRGKRLKGILEKGAAERGAQLDPEGIVRELRERRGVLH